MAKMSDRIRVVEKKAMVGDGGVLNWLCSWSCNMNNLIELSFFITMVCSIPPSEFDFFHESFMSTNSIYAENPIYNYNFVKFVPRQLLFFLSSLSEFPIG